MVFRGLSLSLCVVMESNAASARTCRLVGFSHTVAGGGTATSFFPSFIDHLTSQQAFAGCLNVTDTMVRNNRHCPRPTEVSALNKITCE